MMIVHARRIFVLSLLLLALPLMAAAEEDNSEITFFAGGFLGDSFISHPPPLFNDVEASFDDDFTGGFRYAYWMTPLVALEAGLGFTPSSILSRGTFEGGTDFATLVDVDTYIFHANVLAQPWTGPVRPYVTAGVAAVHFDFGTSAFSLSDTSETDFAWNAGGGLKIPIRHNTSLRMDARYYWMQPEFAVERSRFLEVSGGLSILFHF